MRWMWVVLAYVATAALFSGVWAYLRARPVIPPSADDRTVVRTTSRGMPVTVFSEGLHEYEQRFIGAVLEGNDFSGWSPSPVEAVSACECLFALELPVLMQIYRDYPEPFRRYRTIEFAYFQHYVSQAAYGVQVFGLIQNQRRLLMLNLGAEEPYSGFGHPSWSEGDGLIRVNDGGPAYVQAIIDLDSNTVLQWLPNGVAGEPLQEFGSSIE